MKKSKSYDRLIDVTITEAKYVKDYIIHFKFSDGTNQTVDFKKWIDSNIGGCNIYLNKTLFKKFEILYGKDISWHDDYMSFPFFFLYEEHSYELA